MKTQLFFLLFLFCFLNVIKSQNDYRSFSAQLPFSTETREYQVRKVGTHLVLNGDIIVGSTLSNVRMYHNNDKERGYLWPQGVIPVKIDLSMFRNRNFWGQDMGEYTIDAIDQINRQTRVKLVPHEGQKDYIRITFSPDTTYGGMSPVGRQGDEQVIYITNRSNARTVIHEILHSLGFWHEQSRHDRDQYIQLELGNVDPQWHYAFQIEPGTTAGAYDYQSIMHYTAGAFAKKDGLTTIRCKNGNAVSDCSLGNNRLSAGDIQGLNAVYWYNASLPQVDFRDLWTRTLDYLDLAKIQVGRPQVPQQIRTNLPDGMYKIKVESSGKYLAVEGINKDNGARLVQWDDAENDNHKFYVKNTGDGYVLISAVHSRRYLNGSGQGKADGTPVIQWDYANQDNVKWKIYGGQGQQFAMITKGWTIENKHSGTPMRLSSSYYNKNNGEPLILHQSRRIDVQEIEPTQTFSFVYLGPLPAGL